MRVYLKADPGPIATASPRDEPAKTNGNGGSHANGGEASAFRELLTEFRNLTERYGQALLALGEARGEVAGLRSRVELLEARLDLRLPTSPDATPLAWESPAVAPVPLEAPPAASPAAEPIPASAEPALPTPAPVRRTSRPQKARPTRRTRTPRSTASNRSAVEGFAEALARAQDPTTAEVGEALSLAEPPPEPEFDEGSFVEGAASEQVPEAALAASAEPEAAVEQPAVAEPAVAEPEPAAAEPEPADTFIDTEPEAAVAEPEPAAAELVEDSLEPEAAVAEAEPAAAELVDDSLEPEAAVAELDAAAPELEVAPPERDAVVAEPEPAAAEVEVASEPEPEPEPEPEAGQPTYSATVVEPDWFADGDFAWLDAADLEAGSSPVESAGAPPAEPEAPSAEPEQVEEPPREPIDAIEAEPAFWAQSEPIVEPEGPSMPALPPMPDLPPAIDLPPAPEAQLQASPEAEPEPGLAQSAVEPMEPRPQIDPAEVVEPIDTGARSEALTEEEVMWLGAEAAAASEIEIASTGWQAEPRSTPTMTEDPPVARAEPALLRMTEEELARLARDEGWDDAEVAAIRAMIVPPPPRSVQLPGAAELDDAMAALRAVPPDPGAQSDRSREWAKPPGDERAARNDDWAFEVEPATSPPRPAEPLAPRRQSTDPGWLRSRQGPAATAYRRLRRLFPS